MWPPCACCLLTSCSCLQTDPPMSVVSTVMGMPPPGSALLDKGRPQGWLGGAARSQGPLYGDGPTALWEPRWHPAGGRARGQILPSRLSSGVGVPPLGGGLWGLKSLREPLRLSPHCAGLGGVGWGGRRLVAGATGRGTRGSLRWAPVGGGEYQPALLSVQVHSRMRRCPSTCSRSTPCWPRRSRRR